MKINRILRNSNPFLVVIMLFLFYQLLFFLIRGLEYCLNIQDIVFSDTPIESIEDYSLIKTILAVIIIAPILETVIVQKFGYFLLNKIRIFRKNKCLIVIAGAIIFALFHNFSVMYLINMSLLGFILMYAYVIKRYKGGFWITASIHIINNVLSIFISTSFT